MGHCHGSSMKYTLFFKSYFVNVLLLVNLIFMIFLLKLFLYIEQLKGDFFVYLNRSGLGTTCDSFSSLGFSKQNKTKQTIYIEIY